MRAKLTVTALAVALITPGLALAQQSPATPPPATTEPGMSTAPATSPGPMGTGGPAGTTAQDQPAPPATMGPAGTTAADTGSEAWYAGKKGEEIVGQTLYSANGEEIGEIDNVVIDPQAKKAAAVVGVGGFLGIGEREVAIPLDQLQMGAEDRLTTSMTKESLGGLQAYEEGGSWNPLESGRTVREGMGD